jgi:hypothetical protein
VGDWAVFAYKVLLIFATLGPSWNFSLAENLASLSLQDGHEVVLFSEGSSQHISSGTTQPASQRVIF